MANHVPTYQRVVDQIHRAMSMPYEAASLQFPAMGMIRQNVKTRAPPTSSLVFVSESVKTGKVRFTNHLNKDEPAKDKAKDEAQQQEKQAAQEEKKANEKQQEAINERDEALKKQQEVQKALKDGGEGEDTPKQEKQGEDTPKQEKQEPPGDKEGEKEGEKHNDEQEVKDEVRDELKRQQQQEAPPPPPSDQGNGSHSSVQGCMKEFEQISKYDPECKSIMAEMANLKTDNQKALDTMCTSTCWLKVQAAAEKASTCLEDINSPGEAGTQEKQAAKMLRKTVQVVCSKNSQEYCVTYFGELMNADEMKCSMWDQMGCCAREVVDIAVMMSDMAGAGVDEHDVVVAMKEKCASFPDPLPAPCAACGLQASSLLVALLAFAAMFLKF
eukprot:CAMPEP_0175141884 /NCGR_PEP_ID=MMETSP0087-20121206/12400_1 /TAXON_ID=136419 /ORGANISM="Unknown Unknown, Strain D1" /LENGTH=384 /DNA_ID=CAMNT_0016425443 /DNA_START=138 /DNA_END=1292 /DNA_ORIENTATION=-